MHIRVEGSSDDLRTHKSFVVARLAECIEDALPEVADALHKAVTPKPTALLHPVLEHLRQNAMAQYKDMLQAMESDIKRVLLRGGEGS